MISSNKIIRVVHGFIEKSNLEVITKVITEYEPGNEFKDSVQVWSQEYMSLIGR